MERLTVRDKDATGYKGCAGCPSPDYGFECTDCEETAKCRDKLADYEDAEEQGRLITFPVAIGDHLWHIDDYGDIEDMFVEELVERRQGQTLLANTEGMRAYYSLDLIGKKIFYTREEAEAKLKELEG